MHHCTTSLAQKLLLGSVYSLCLLCRRSMMSDLPPLPEVVPPVTPHPMLIFDNCTELPLTVSHCKHEGNLECRLQSPICRQRPVGKLLTLQLICNKGAPAQLTWDRSVERKFSEEYLLEVLILGCMPSFCCQMARMYGQHVCRTQSVGHLTQVEYRKVLT